MPATLCNHHSASLGLNLCRHTIKRPSDIGAIWEDSDDEPVVVAEESQAGGSIWCGENSQRKQGPPKKSGQESSSDDDENQLSAYEANLPDWKLQHHHQRLVPAILLCSTTVYPILTESYGRRVLRLQAPQGVPLVL